MCNIMSHSIFFVLCPFFYISCCCKLFFQAVGYGHLRYYFLFIDFGDDILELCSSNLTQNEQLYKGHSVLVRELDWTSSEFKKGLRMSLNIMD